MCKMHCQSQVDILIWYFFALGILIIASVLDFKNLQVPNIISFSLIFLALTRAITSDLDFFTVMQVKSLLITLAITIPGYISKQFGAADIKILLALALITPWSLMIMLLIVSFIVFTIYASLFYAKSKQAPFVPAICIAVGIHTIPLY